MSEREPGGELLLLVLVAGTLWFLNGVAPAPPQLQVWPMDYTLLGIANALLVMVSVSLFIYMAFQIWTMPRGNHDREQRH